MPALGVLSTPLGRPMGSVLPTPRVRGERRGSPHSAVGRSRCPWAHLDCIADRAPGHNSEYARAVEGLPERMVHVGRLVAFAAKGLNRSDGKGAAALYLFHDWRHRL